MSAFFGIDEHNAQGFVRNNIVCLPHNPAGQIGLHSIVSPLRSEDIVFIKHCMPQSTLHVTAVGVVRSDFPRESGGDVCLPVEWVWQGDKDLENSDEVLALSGEPFYEEHNIQIQREIIDLLPEKYQLPREW